MNRTGLITVLILTFGISVLAQKSTIVGELKHYPDFASKFVKPRNINVWLPPNYNTNTKKKYPVIYMQDGQMLFDELAAGRTEVGVDEVMTRLIAERKIREAIVVGIWNTDQRLAEYMPQKAFEMASEEQKADARAYGVTKVESDNYLKFLVTELKPFVDKNYRTNSSRQDTFVAGSSMGGLISLYAVSEYPEVFGGAACISTHFPANKGVVIEYMKTNLPSPKNHKIYFDYGTKSLDAEYEPYQLKADEVMQKAGYKKGKNWITQKFEGASHDEKSWSARIDVALLFLLGK